jgi:AAA family ATP:ADP antiporter
MSSTTSGTVSGVGPRETRGHRGPLERLLGLFADVHSGEGVTALLLMLNILLLLAAYYLLKTIREPLILSVPGGAEVKSYSAAAMAGLLLFAVPLYSAVANRISRVKLINGVTLFFIACLVAFFALNLAGVPIGVAFFIWVGIFNLMIIAQMWAFANDVYTVEQGQRLFAIVGFGASLGAILGAFVTGQLVKRYGPYPFMLGSAGLLALSMVLTNLVHRRERRRLEARATHDAREAAAEGAATRDASGKARGGFSLVLSDRYLLLIGLLVLVLNLVNTNGEYALGKTVVNQYLASHPGAGGSLDEKQVIGAFYGNYFTIVNIVAAALQLFVVSRVLKYFGVRVGLLVLPVVALAGYSTLAFVPLLGLIRATKMAENSIDYSLQNTTGNALYLPTSRAAKYNAKQANDTFFVRFGDVVSAGIVFAGTTWLGLTPRHVAMVNVVLILVWIGLAIVIGRRYRRLAAAS